MKPWMQRVAPALLVRARGATGLSQADLARLAGVSRSVLSVYGSRKREPSSEALARILAAAGFEPDRMSVLGQRLLAIHEALTGGGIPHAFGGAIALAYCTEEPRGTRDLDVNVFVEPAAAESVLAAPRGDDRSWHGRQGPGTRVADPTAGGV